MMLMWNVAVDRQVDGAIEDLATSFPGSQITVFEVLDDRGVVAIAVAAGEGRLVVAVRTVDLVEVDWGWADGLVSTVGVLPDRAIPTVEELVAGLVKI